MQKHRRNHPAANHAAEAIVIYPLNRKKHTELRERDAENRIIKERNSSMILR